PARIGVLATAGFGFGLLLHDEVESGARVAEFLDEGLNRRCPIQVRAGERDRTFVLDRALDDRPFELRKILARRRLDEVLDLVVRREAVWRFAVGEQDLQGVRRLVLGARSSA